MGLLDSLNEIVKKTETLVQTGGEISKVVTNIAQNTSKAVTSYLPAQKSHSNQKTANLVSDKKAVAKSNEEAPMTFKSIGCSDKTISIIQMSLSDGMIDEREKALMIRRVKEENIDVQEFDFLLAKTLEVYHKMAKNCIKDLSAAFAMADKMAAKEEKANATALASALPKVSGMVSNPTGIAVGATTDTVM